MINRSLQFGARTAEELMTPRSKIESLEVTNTVSDLIAAAIRTVAELPPELVAKAARMTRIQQ